MRKIIDKKLYDTDQAMTLAYIKTGGIEGIYYAYEILYEKIDGTFFLYSTVGPDPSMYRNDGDIVPVTEEDARAWVAEHLSVEEYEKLFGPIK
ncbi:hypothetical protein [Butyricicoccus intestinisimiae]|uniref:DUF1292 domain-containing protein n=1 Tax=Butyricicoccus intestinisimiae TaxID=2841509 RepID=A0ABS6EQ12_9FIRM|nr:hypothetical protein [Butyricicoccus intestinisimiae]MBU5489590.1 hypothetical protein [Butyricicoccus intestinisimiae]